MMSPHCVRTCPPALIHIQHHGETTAQPLDLIEVGGGAKASLGEFWATDFSQFITVSANCLNLEGFCLANVARNRGVGQGVAGEIGKHLFTHVNPVDARSDRFKSASVVGFGGVSDVSISCLREPPIKIRRLLLVL